MTHRDAFRVLHVDGSAVTDQPLGGLDVFDGVERCISVFVGYIDIPSWCSGQRRECGKLDDGEVRDTLRHKIFENSDMAVGSRSVPGSVIHIRRNWRCHNQSRAALTLVCTCTGQGRLEIRLDQKIRVHAHEKTEKFSRPCCSINSFKNSPGLDC